MNQTQTPVRTPPVERSHETRNTASDREGRAMGIFLLFLAFFEIAVLLIVLLRPLGVSGNNPSPDAGTETDEPSAKPDDSPAVFEGGVTPLPLQSTASTVSLGDGIFSRFALLVNADTGEIMASRNADTVFSPASMTKVMTLIIACENLTLRELDERVTLTQEVQDYVSSGNYAEASCSLIDRDKYLNDEFTLRDLLYGIGVESAADCCIMAVSYVCPAPTLAESEAKFVALMNRKAADMGLANTHFDNVIGYESKDNVTTAEEMARIMLYAMQSNLIRSILGVKSYGYLGYYYDGSGTLKTYNRNFYSTLFRERMETYQNRMGKEFSLSSAKLTAGKTGSFVSSSYLVLEATANSDGSRYILVLGDAPKGDLPASIGTMRDVITVLDTFVQ